MWPNDCFGGLGDADQADIVSAPSGPLATIILQDGSLDRLGNLYRGRGGPPIRKVLL